MSLHDGFTGHLGLSSCAPGFLDRQFGLQDALAAALRREVDLISGLPVNKHLPAGTNECREVFSETWSRRITKIANIRRRDLAANKALAAASRKRERDFADLWLLDTHVMPLWRMACAASGKFPNESRLSRVDLTFFNMHLAMVQDDTPMILTRDVSEAVITSGLTKSMQEARETMGRLGTGFMDRLQVDGDDLPVTESRLVETGRWISPVRGGAMPSFDGMDGEMIKSLVKAYHEDDGTSVEFCHS